MKHRYTISVIKKYVNDDEGMYIWWRNSGMTIDKFIERNREELEEYIFASISK